MAERMQKGVIVEFDFAAMNGAELLHETTAGLLKANGVGFDARAEARHLAGGNYQGGLAEYFAAVKSGKDPSRIAKELADAFSAALAEAVPSAVTPAFGAFVRTLAGKGLKVVIATRADVDKVAPAFAGLLSGDVVLYREASQCYGGVKWDAWRRACARNGLRNFMSVAVTGSGFGVKAALLAGMGSLAVVNDRVAYQDFGGADDIVPALDESAAKTVLQILRVS